MQALTKPLSIDKHNSPAPEYDAERSWPISYLKIELSDSHFENRR